MFCFSDPPMLHVNPFSPQPPFSPSLSLTGLIKFVARRIQLIRDRCLETCWQCRSDLFRLFHLQHVD
jgi:hypothetical protein